MNRTVTILLISLWCIVTSISAETIYRLPVRTAIDDSSAINLFSTALDTVLSQSYTLVILGSHDPFNPDSSACSPQLGTNDSSRYIFDFDLYIASENQIRRHRLNVGKEQVSFLKLKNQIESNFKNNTIRNLQLAHLRIRGLDGSLVFLNRVLTGQTPFETFTKPGFYDITLSGRTLFRHNFSLSLDAGQDTLITLDFWKEYRPQRISFAIGSLICGGLALYLNQVQIKAYKDYYNATSDFDSSYDAYRLAVAGRNTAVALSAIGVLCEVIFVFDIPFSHKNRLILE